MNIELPEYADKFLPRWPGDEGGYTADQMRAYGAACAAAERERCAKVCEDLGYLLDDSGAYAAAIRA